MTGWRAIPILGVRDVAATAEYFRDVLGFRVVDVHQPGGVPVYAVLCREEASVHVQIRRRDPYPAGREAHETEIYFEVPDVDALYAEYAARAVTLLRDIQDEPYGMRDFTIELPDGGHIAFATPLA
jgi:catechol 2,3-dioxygenase-like lactoylglutathione lyase family enzyme